MTTNIAEVLKLAARPTPYDNDERTWLEFRFKLENYLTLVNEKYAALLQDAESQLVLRAHPNVESHAVRHVGDTDHRTKLETGAKSTEQKRRGDSWWRKTHQKRVEDLRCCKPCCNRDWEISQENSMKFGPRANIRWTSTTSWRRHRWMMT